MKLKIKSACRSYTAKTKSIFSGLNNDGSKANFPSQRSVPKRKKLHNRLDLANTMEAVHRVDRPMPSRLRDLSINQALVMPWFRLLLWGAIILNLGIESLEMTVAKDIHHLALFSILILFANLQLSISKFLLSMEDDDRAKQLFVMAVLTLAAAFLQVVELGLDQLLIYLSQGPKGLLFRILIR